MQYFSWYNTIAKPALTPPASVFPPVWTVLYIMIGLSFIFYIKDGIKKEDTLALTFFFVQLILNLLWSPVFFGLHNIKLAMIIVILMIIFVLATIICFYKKSKPAAFLLIPYLIWISFAAYLNFGIMRLN